MIGLLLLLAAAGAPRFDLVLSAGRVIDGTGAPWVRADVGIRGDRVAAIGDLSRAKATRRIDVHGLTIAPGFIETDMSAPIRNKAGDLIEKKMIPMKRIGKPEDVVGAVVYLASPAADLVTGHTLLVDGGWTAV